MTRLDCNRYQVYYLTDNDINFSEILGCWRESPVVVSIYGVLGTLSGFVICLAHLMCRHGEKRLSVHSVIWFLPFTRSL